MSDIAQLYGEINGKRFGVTGPDYGQCTAVPHRFSQLNGVPLTYGNAVNMLANADPNLYEKGTGYPPRNACVVWGKNSVVNTGDAGHVAVSNGERNGNLFQSLDQNWPTGAAAQLIWHTTDGVIGWYRLKNQSNQGNSAVRTEAEWLAYEQKLLHGEGGIDYWIGQTAAAREQATAATGQVQAQQKVIDGLNGQISSLQKQPAQPVPVTPPILETPQTPPIVEPPKDESSTGNGIQKYNKGLVAAATALGVATTLLSDGKLSAAEGVTIATAFLGALGVVAIPNKK